MSPEGCQNLGSAPNPSFDTLQGAFRLDFANDQCVGIVLSPGDSCTYGILYAPVVPGHQTGNSDIEFTSTDNSLGIANIGLSGHAQLPRRRHLQILRSEPSPRVSVGCCLA